LTLNQILLVTNVSNNSIIYNFADPAAGGYLISNVLYLSANTTSMADTDYLQIFLDDLLVPSTDNTLSSVNTTLGTSNSYLSNLNSTISASMSALRTVPLFVNFDSATRFGGHYPVGGRYVDATSFAPITSVWGVSALSGFDASFNIDMTTGGAMMLQGDLDKDIDSVTNFDVGYASISNYLSAVSLGGDFVSTGTQVLSANGNRITMFIQNMGIIPLMVKYGLGCNMGSFSYILYPGISIFDGRGEKLSDDRYKGDVSINTTTGLSAYYIAWEGV
jgi:hypothetical protein